MKSIIILLIVGMALNASLRESNYEKLQAQMNIMKSTMSLMDAEMKGMQSIGGGPPAFLDRQSRAGGDALTTSVVLAKAGMGRAGGCNSNCLSCCDHAISDATTLGNCHDGCNTGTWTISVCSGCCSSGSC